MNLNKFTILQIFLQESLYKFGHLNYSGMIPVSFPCRLSDDQEIVTLHGQYRHKDGSEVGLIVTHPHPLLGGSMKNNVTKALALGLSDQFSTLCFNTRGVGKSTGESTWSGTAERHDMAAAVRFLVKTKHIRRVYVIGYSFGASVAGSVCHALPPVVGYVAVSYPCGFFSRFLLGHHMEALRATKHPKLLLSGDYDEITDFSTLQSFANSLKGSKEISLIIGADHSYMRFEPQLIKQIRDWITRMEGAVGLRIDRGLSPYQLPFLPPTTPSSSLSSSSSSSSSSRLRRRKRASSLQSSVHVHNNVHGQSKSTFQHEHRDATGIDDSNSSCNNGSNTDSSSTARMMQSNSTLISNTTTNVSMPSKPISPLDALIARRQRRKLRMASNESLLATITSTSTSTPTSPTSIFAPMSASPKSGCGAYVTTERSHEASPSEKNKGGRIADNGKGKSTRTKLKSSFKASVGTAKDAFRNIDYGLLHTRACDRNWYFYLALYTVLAYITYIMALR